jgi:hypothetical protein
MTDSSDNTKVLWKDIPNTTYLISSAGAVMNKFGRSLVQSINTAGYCYVTLYVNKNPINSRVHRLVAEAFLEKPTAKLTVNHIDNNKLNNNIENLEWMSLEDNYRLAIDAGLLSHGEDRYNSKLNDELVLEILDLMSEGIPDITLAAVYGVSRTIMYKVRKNISWRHLKREPLPTIDSKQKLTAADIPEIRALFDTATDTEIGKTYSVSSGTIHQIRTGKNWKNY